MHACCLWVPHKLYSNLLEVRIPFVTRSTKTGPNRTTGRCRFSLPIESCNNVLMNHASATANSTSVCFSCGGFLGHVLVGYKWLWWLLTSRRLAVNHHTTANWCHSSIWLLFVVIGAQINHCWGYFRLSVTDVCSAHHFIASHHPQPTTPSRSLVVLVKKPFKLMDNSAMGSR